MRTLWARELALERRGGTAFRCAECAGGGVLAEGTGEAAEGTAPAGSGRLAFEPADRGHAQPSLVGEFFLG